MNSTSRRGFVMGFRSSARCKEWLIDFIAIDVEDIFQLIITDLLGIYAPYVCVALMARSTSSAIQSLIAHPCFVDY